MKRASSKGSHGPHMLSTLLSRAYMKSFPEQLLLFTDDSASQED